MQHAIRVFPDPCLRQRCEPVRHFDRSLQQLIENLRKVMHQQKMGIGIAAPQIGVTQQVAIVDVSARVSGAKEIVLINPVLEKTGGETLSHEGCMSLPEYTGYVQRAESIRYRYQTLTGEGCTGESSGLEAICIQHEMDHLQGQLFFDRVTTLKTDMQPRHWKKKTKR